MYGMIHRALIDYVRTHHGEGMVERVKASAQCSEETLITMQFYPDAMTYGLVGAARDVHFPGRTAFAGRQAGLPAESGAGSFRDANGYPFLLEIPNTWRFPLERVRIDAAYPQFAQWRNSAGAQARSWYLSPTSTANRVSNAIDQYVPQRDWTVLLPPQ